MSDTQIEFAAGDIVWPKAGSQEMTVEVIDGDMILTSWKDATGQEHSAEFAPEDLTKENPNEPVPEELGGGDPEAIDLVAGDDQPAADLPAESAGPSEEPQAVEEEPVAEPEPKKVIIVGSGESVSALRERVRMYLSNDKADAWSRTQLLTYLETGAHPSKTRRGNWPYDARRTDMVERWSGAELHDWVDGYITPPEGLDEERIWNEVYRRWKIPGNWTIQSVREYLDSGKEPEKTKHGVLVRDRQRESKTIDQWTYLEIRSALLQEIGSPFDTKELVSALRKRLNLTENYSEKLLLDSLTETPTESTVNTMVLKAKLDEFKTIMTRNGQHLTEASAGAAQTMLYKTIRQVMALPYVEFFEGWNILLDYINENYNALFTPERIHRGWGNLQMGTSARATYEDLLTLMVHTRNPRGRAQEAKLYKLGQILRFVPKEEERQNIMTYYAE